MSTAASPFSTCFTKGQWVQINITSNPFCPRKSSRFTVLPVTTSRRAKSGASEPNSSCIVDSVNAIVQPPGNLNLHLLAFSATLDRALLRPMIKPILGTRGRYLTGRQSPAVMMPRRNIHDEAKRTKVAGSTLPGGARNGKASAGGRRHQRVHGAAGGGHGVSRAL